MSFRSKINDAAPRTFGSGDLRSVAVRAEDRIHRLILEQTSPSPSRGGKGEESAQPNQKPTLQALEELSSSPRKRRNADFQRRDFMCNSSLRQKSAMIGVVLAILCLAAPTVYAQPSSEIVGDDEEFDAGIKYLEWLLEDRVTERGVMGSLLNAWSTAQNMPNNRDGATWEPLGPAPLLSGGARVSGRTNAIAIHPQDPNVIYIG